MEILVRIKSYLGSLSKITLAVIAGGALILGWLLWPRSEPESVIYETDESSQWESSEISVHLVGEILNPGLYKLPLGSRVSDVVDLAGGISEKASMESINLARILVDGEQIIVKSSIQHQDELNSKISINDAGADQLDQLPGVGPSIAGKIVDYRDKNGPFRSLEQLTEVSGIGTKMLENIRDLIRL